MRSVQAQRSETCIRQELWRSVLNIKKEHPGISVIIKVGKLGMSSLLWFALGSNPVDFRTTKHTDQGRVFCAPYY